MPSIIRIEKNNQIYLYESKSYWNKEKKAPRTKMVYLGKEDPVTKKLVSPGIKWTPRIARDYGNIYLLNKISNEIGLAEILQEAFPEEWRKLLMCAFFEVSEGKPLYLCSSWLESTYTDITDGFSSQRISELLKSVGENEYSRREFSQLWAQKRHDDKFVVFDITSISSYSKLIEIVEWGYNRDKEKLPQINFGMVYGQPSLLPIFYTLYPGSIRDVSTLENVLQFLAEFPFKKVTFIMDKGFYSRDNLFEMKSRGLHCIMALPFTVDEAGKLIEKHQKEIDDISKAIRVNKQVLYCVKDKIRIDHRIFNAYVYFDKRKRLEAEERLVEKLMEAEEKIQRRQFRNSEAVRSYLADHCDELRRFFHIRRENGAFVLRREKGSIENLLMQTGYLVILSTRNMKIRDVILLYRNKDCVEKCFDTMKNELSTNRLRVHSRESMEGRLFISFLALILLSWIHKRMREKDLTKRYTVDEVMFEMKKLKIIELKEGRQVLTEITKSQRDLFKQLINSVPEL